MYDIYISSDIKSVFHCFPRLLRQTTASLPWALRIRILYQTARGMNALHLLKPKLLHMDLKPGNILLTDFLEVRVSHLEIRMCHFLNLLESSVEGHLG